MLKVKKLNGTERKKISEQEQKSSPELGKIVDMPLIPSANMIAVIRKECSPTTNSVITSAEKKTEMTTHKYSLVCDADKKNVTNAANGVLTTRKTEVEMSRIPSVQSAPNNNVAESDCVSRTATSKNSECLSQNDKRENGIELTLTPLRNEKAFESDRSVNAGDIKNAKTVDNSKNIPSPRQVECESTEEKKFCFENSRELAGEPDGKADDAEITEPPALPNNPPPVISTEPRQSFLHGSVNNDPKAKPAVPQKPVILSAKTNPNPKTSPIVVKKIPDYVLPPPSVQNVASKSVQNSG